MSLRPPLATPAGSLTLSFDATPGTSAPEDHPRMHLSAVAPDDGCLWVGADEGASVERLEPTGPGAWGRHASFHIGDLFALPDSKRGEVDVEGLCVDGDALWVVGSHSLARREPEPGDDPVKARKRLATLRTGLNRHVLARLPIERRPGQAPTLVAKAGGHEAAFVRFIGGESSLYRALQKDPHVGPFTAVPSKDNGLDMEGIAARGDRVFLGLRGPVLRGHAIILDLKVTQKHDELRLVEFEDGPEDEKGQVFVKHFLDLEGLGIRDLCLHGDDLLILAGPTMDLAGTVGVWRWPDALRTPHAGQILSADTLKLELLLPYGTAIGKAEGLAMYTETAGGPERLLVVYDAPPESRLHGSHGVAADLF